MNQEHSGIVPSALSQSWGWNGKSISHELIYLLKMGVGSGAPDILRTIILFPSKVVSA